MPNWCENDLRVSIEYNDNPVITKDRVKVLKEFVKFCKGTGKFKDGEQRILDFNRFVPYPENFAKQDKKSRDWEIKADEFAKKNGCTHFYCGDKLSDKKREQFYKKYGKQETDGYNKGGYEWCIGNWGTKWNAADVQVLNYDKQRGEWDITFNTAWAPPLPIIVAMSKRFPDLEFRLTYFEMGCAFNGLFVCKEGKVIENKQGEYFGDRGG